MLEKGMNKSTDLYVEKMFVCLFVFFCLRHNPNMSLKLINSLLNRIE